ncbi:MAG: type I glyceraldehyde-3-phosphate dehydrogenase [Nanoarchaeota archaeon]|nr:type I glyceraldehyde-3-phosphate dehydrogenase [Nanoarchaeota archaeon]
MVKVAINGFGRIGRLVLRAGYEEKDIEFVAVNDLGDINTMAHLLKFDSVHGKFSGKVDVKGNDLVVDGKKIKFLSEKEPEKLPWKELGVDVVVESTGIFRTKEDVSKHIKAGAKKVLLSSPGKGDEPIQTVVIGVNSNDAKKETIISNASCTTNSIAPVIDVLEKEFGVETGFLTTVHSYTNDQKILDLPHSDLRRARAAAINIIPTSTGAAKAVGEVVPNVKGKMDGMAIRVPTPNASITDLTVVLKKETTAEDVNNALKKAANSYLKGVLEYSEEELVSTDIIGNPYSAIIDSKLTKCIGKLCKVCSWYDNEWGFSMRMIETIKLMG